MNPLTLTTLLDDPRFLTGVGMGLVGALAIRLTARRLDWFAGWSVATMVGLAFTSIGLWPGQAEAWMLGAALATVGAVTLAAPTLVRRTQGWVSHALFCIAVLGVWGTLPDTEHVRVLLGAGVSMLLLASGRRATPSSAPWLVVATAILTHVVVLDGWPRNSAVVGACGTVGMLVVAPAALVLDRQRRGGSSGHRAPLAGWPLIGAQVVLVILSGRVAGRTGSTVAALGLLAIIFVVVGSGWVVADGWRHGEASS